MSARPEPRLYAPLDADKIAAEQARLAALSNWLLLAFGAGMGGVIGLVAFYLGGQP
jgi:hypothetical protein